MAHFYRVVFALGLMLMGIAHAAFPVPTGPNETQIAAVLASRIAACNQWNGGGANPCFLGFRGEGPTTSPQGYSAVAGETLFVTLMGGAFMNSIWVFDKVQYSSACPANSTGSAGTCSCNSGFQQNAANNACVAPVACGWMAGTKIIEFGTFGVSLTNTSICYSGCKMVLEDASFVPSYTYRKDAASPWMGEFNMGNFVGNGAVCDAGEGISTAPATPSATQPTVLPAAPQSQCPPGQIPGTVTVSGITTTLCQPAIIQREDKKMVVDKPSAAGPVQETTTTSTTCNEAGSCTTTVTINTSVNGGAPTSATTSTTQDKKSYCADPAGKKDCGGGSGQFSGNCEAGFKGDGDPATVAMAIEIHRQNCLLNKPSDESTLYDTERVKEGNQTAGLPGNKTVTVSPSDFDTSNALAAGSCIANKTVVIWGRTVVLPFSDVCPALGYLRNILLAVAYLAAAGIVLGRK